MIRRPGAVDELLQAGVQLVVEGRGGPVGVERDAVFTGEGIEVVDQFPALRVGDVRRVCRDGHAAGAARIHDGRVADEPDRPVAGVGEAMERLPESAYDTVLIDTPATRATS